MVKSSSGTDVGSGALVSLPPASAPTNNASQLATLLNLTQWKRSSERRGLCIQIGIKPPPFIDTSSEDAFPLELIDHLSRTGRFPEIIRLCDTIKNDLGETYLPEWERVHAHFTNLIHQKTAEKLTEQSGPADTAQNSNHCVQVIGWGGIERPILYRTDISPIKAPACLVGMGSMETLPPLTFRKRPFDIVIADIEYLDRYHNELQRLQVLKRPVLDVNVLWHQLAPAIATEKIEEYKELGIPIQFGFMEILANKRWLNGYCGTDSSMTYDKFNVFKVLDYCKLTGTKVGLWDLYLPTLTHVLATVYSSHISKPETKESLIPNTVRSNLVKHVHEKLRIISQKQVEDITKRISTEYKDCVKFLDSAHEVTRGLDTGTIGIVYGGGSSLIVPEAVVKPRMPRNVELLVPQNFLFLWMNCCALLQAGNRDRFPGLVRRWLDKDAQVDLSSYEEYRGCPVTKAGLHAIRQNPNHPACRTLKKVLDNNCSVRSGYTLSIRTLPNDWRGWQKSWEDMRREFKKERETFQPHRNV